MQAQEASRLTQEVLIAEDEVQVRIAELGRAISNDYGGQDLLLVAILKGSVVFLADLMRAITIPHQIDFMAVTSYGVGARASSGVVRILMDLAANIEGRNVLIIEDIIDTGQTLHYITRILHERGPKSLRICTLLNKASRREVDIPVDYVGFDIPDSFVFGFGLDVDEFHRNLPYVAVLKPGASAQPMEE
ncbi:MAG TPA: hypoxanthine phosphoribosyltransferase [Anaerolineae bacterium]|nr:hypoxanthine phosphoribosyltransferase [Anaerolineae bacterium]HOQ98709.1 hypoxanthine phosphoribosyltransferase [Anaerolineae bacterium]HPL29602.1 hypoxanthine phosphoribosyltransferase [Anaerolineae bacterium]